MRTSDLTVLMTSRPIPQCLFVTSNQQCDCLFVIPGCELRSFNWWRHETSL